MADASFRFKKPQSRTHIRSLKNEKMKTPDVSVRQHSLKAMSSEEAKKVERKERSYHLAQIDKQSSRGNVSNVIRYSKDAE